MINHFPTCNALYPEKPEKEQAQFIIEIEGDGIVSQVCVDCGAFELVKNKLTNIVDKNSDSIP